MSAPSTPAAPAATHADRPSAPAATHADRADGSRAERPAHEPSGHGAPPPGGGLGPAAGWQDRFLTWLNRRRRLSALVPVVVLVLGTPHACPFC